MKKILVTGLKSYIGTSFGNFIKANFANDYVVDYIDLRDVKWKEKSFSGYDSIVHVAGLVHQKETDANKNLYYKINRDLTFEVAQKAKDSHVSQFVFLSTMGVYGQHIGVITKNTVPNPKTNYGKSKLQAEKLISVLKSDNFKVCILRLPMVYGDDCKGNYQNIVKIVEKLPIFPRVNNKRSLIHIENLVSFIKMVIDKRLDGIYFPQNREYIKTIDLAKEIACQKKKKIYFSFLLGFVVVLLRPFSGKLKKAFGNLMCVDTEDFEFKYCIK